MYDKLLKIQQEIGAIKKDSTNPFFKSKYFDINTLLEHVKPVLNKHGVVLLQGLTTTTDNKPALSTRLISDKDSIEYSVPLPEVADAQKMGGAITYFRRYAIQSLLALEAEDDDGNAASGRTYTPVAQKKATELKNKEDKDNGVPAF